MITDTDAPRGRDLEMLVARRAALTAAEPSPAAAIATRVARLFQRFPTMANATPEQVAAYVADLQRFPLWAIDRGMIAIVSGQIMRATEFPPTSLDVQKAVRLAFDPIVDEIAALNSVLNAIPVPLPSGEERQRVHGLMLDLAAEIVRSNGPEGAVPARPRDMRLPSSFDEAAARIHDAPIVASEALKASLARRSA